ncbi:MAG: PIN domain-containing protein [Candidatus Dojkabacteria bacterium]
MPKKIIIRNIALDTSFIEAQNFLAGRILYDLADLGRKRVASIYLTDIVYREALARFGKRVTEEDNKIKSVKKTIHSSVRVLKNFEDYKCYFTLPELNLPALIEDFKLKFDKWIEKANIKIISTNTITIGGVFDDYFKSNPPFGAGEKKHEFPDAFSFVALENYFKIRDEKCLFVSHDKDFDEMKSKHIIPTREITEKIDIILRAEEEKKSETLKLIDKGYIEHRKKLEKQAHKMITSFLEDSVYNQEEIQGMEIDVLDKIDLSDVEFTDYKIIFIGQNSARIECQGNFAYELTIAVEDNSEAIYDKEDGIYYGTEHRSIVIKDNKDEKFSVVLDFELGEDYIESEVNDINDGNGFEVFKRHDDYYH